jgi:ABC-type glycerol-3-phosphate transport system substrate-binding protein
LVASLPIAVVSKLEGVNNPFEISEKEYQMKILKIGCVSLVLCCMAFSYTFAGGQEEAAKAEEVNVDYWSTYYMWGPFPDYFRDAAEQFNVARPEVKFSVNPINIPYEGYEAKYASAFEANKGPGMFNEMTHPWASKGYAEPMPADLVKKVESLLNPHVMSYGVYEGTRYGIPTDGGLIMLLYINVDYYNEAGLDSNSPPTTYTEMLEHAMKLTKKDASGNITRSGYAIRYKGHPFGVADKSAPFYHAWGTQWLNWDEKKASGYINSPEAVEALQFYADLVQKHKVSSLEVGNPTQAFGQGNAAMMFRECVIEKWLETNAPDLNYKVYPLPSQKMESGYLTNFPLAENVSNQVPESQREWIWEFFRWYIDAKEVRRQHYTGVRFLPVYKDIIDDQTFRNMKVYEAWKTTLKGRQAPTYYIPPAHEILSIIGQATLDAMYGKVEPKSVLDRIAGEIDDILAKY